jgi:hypothetical protein
MFSKRELNKRVLVSITGETDNHWKNKIKEINSLGLKKVALFNERFTPVQRRGIYEALLDSGVDEIPFVHGKNDMTKDEFKFLMNNFNTQRFNIHWNSLKYLPKWKGYHKYLFAELSYHNQLPKGFDIKKIGGFCVDLAHFKCAEELWSNEFDYITSNEKHHELFQCNHVSGYSPWRNRDIHTVRKITSFDYLKSLPKFLFGQNIAIEVDNPITSQLRFRDYIIELLSKRKNYA